MKAALLLGCILLTRACVHCGESGSILFNGNEVRFNRPLIYHHELYQGSGGNGHLVCTRPQPLLPYWYYPTGKRVSTKKTGDFFQKPEVNRSMNIVRLSSLSSINQIDNETNGLWQCRYTDLSGGISPVANYYVAIYAQGLGAITSIKCSPGNFSRTRSHGQIICITKGGPPTLYMWTHNGHVVLTNDAENISSFSDSVTVSGQGINQEDYESSSYTSTLNINGFHTGEYQYQVLNRAMSVYTTQIFRVQGDAPSDVKVEVVGSERIQVSWLAPSVPPGDGYEVTIDNQTSSAVRVQLSHTFINVTPGVHSIQVKSLSQHYPGKVAEVRTVRVPAIEIYLSQSSTFANLSWIFPSDRKDFYRVQLSRVTGQLQELCPNYQDVRKFTTAKMSLSIKNLQEFSNYTVKVSSTKIPPTSIEFTTPSTAPTSAPGGLSHSVSSRTVRVNWKPVACIELNGPQLGYEVDFVLLNGTKTPVGEVIGEIFQADRLAPGTHYTFKVAVRNKVGRGPFSSALRLQLDEEAPGIVSNIAAEIVESTVVMSWSPPREPNGAIIAYEVSYTLNNQPPTIINVTNVHYNISKLDFGTFISPISVRAYTKIGPGPIARTEISIEEIMVTNIQVTLIPDTTSVRVEWDSINSRRLAHYAVIYSSDNTDKQSITVPSSENFVVITKLDDNKEYMFQVIGIGTINTVNTQNNTTGSMGAGSNSSVFIPCEDCLQTAIISGSVGAVVTVGIVAACFMIRLYFYKHSMRKLSSNSSSYWSSSDNSQPNVPPHASPQHSPFAPPPSAPLSLSSVPSYLPPPISSAPYSHLSLPPPPLSSSFTLPLSPPVYDHMFVIKKVEKISRRRISDPISSSSM